MVRMIGTVESVGCEGGAEVFDWKIENFSKISDKVNPVCASPDFRFFDCTWYLSLYPNGFRVLGTAGYIGLRLVSRCIPSCSLLLYLRLSLCIRSARGETEVEVTRNYYFRESAARGEDKLISRSELLRRRDELLPMDVLTLRVMVQKEGFPLRDKGNKRIKKGEKEAGDVPTAVGKCQQTGKTDQRNVSVQRGVEDVSTALATKCKICEERGKATDTRTIYVQTESEDLAAAERNYEQTGGTGTRDASVMTEVEDFVADHGRVELDERTGAQSVGKDVGKMWPDGEHFDVVFKAGDKEFQAHKGILEARTPVLAAAFRHDTLEKTSGVVEIDDCEPAVFEQLLYYVYKGVPSELSAKNACPLYVLADKYLVIQLKALCLRCIRDTLCTDTFCSTVVLSLMHKEDELLETAIDFFSRNMIPVLQSVQWQVFNREHPTWANEIMIRGVKIGQERRPDGDSSRA